jgi:hypothetical protein
MENNRKKRALTTPLKSKMVVPIILGAVAETPGITYQSLREILKPYTKDYAVTDSILQEGRHLAKELLFGSADDNVQYVDGLHKELTALGHEVELLFSDRKATIQLQRTREGIMAMMMGLMAWWKRRNRMLTGKKGRRKSVCAR